VTTDHERRLLVDVAARVNALAARSAPQLDGWQEVVHLLGDGSPPGSVAACAAAVDEALGHPSHRLAAYGTLRPGEDNHHLVAGLGSWRAALVRGTVGDWQGYPILRPDEDGEGTVEVMVLTAAGLPARLGDLDRFEGPAYRREWVVADLVGEPGAIVAQAYVDAHPPA
jgi:gamma-glutamylcyclotransferase (GGCT)/AIG2-like uncharacterized protein YtfP